MNRVNNLLILILAIISILGCNKENVITHKDSLDIDLWPYSELNDADSESALYGNVAPEVLVIAGLYEDSAEFWRQSMRIYIESDSDLSFASPYGGTAKYATNVLDEISLHLESACSFYLSDWDLSYYDKKMDYDKQMKFYFYIPEPGEYIFNFRIELVDSGTVIRTSPYCLKADWLGDEYLKEGMEKHKYLTVQLSTNIPV